MPIPTGGLITRLDFSNPASYPGSGTAVYDLTANNNDFAFQNNNFTYSTVYGGEVFIDSSNILKTSVPLTAFGYGTTAFTINIWMQQHTEGGSNLSMFNALSDTGGSGPAHGNLYFGTQTGPTFFVTDGTDVLFQNTTFPLNTWKMITITKPANGGSDSIKVYIDGSQITFTSSGTSTPISLASSNCYIDSVVANLGVWSLDMTVGEYSVYNVELSSGQVSDYYNETRNRFSIVAKYDFSDPTCYPGTGNTVYDLAESNNLSLQNSPVFSGGGNSKYFDFSGGTFNPSYLNRTGQISGIGTNPVMSMNAWLRIPNYGSQSYEPFFGYGNDQGGGGIFSLWKRYDGVTSGIFRNNFGSNNTNVNTLTVQPLNEWVNICCTTVGTASTIYVDGAFVAHNLSGNGFIGTVNGPYLSLGAISLGGYAAECDIAYFELYNVSLSPADVLSNYNAIAPRFDNLVAKYDLNDPLSYSGTGSTLYDLSENNYDITLDYGPTYHTYSGYNALEFNRNSGTTATRVGSLGLGTSNPQFTFAMWVKPIDLTNPVNYSWFISYGKENGAIGGAPMILAQYNGPLNLTSSFGSARAMYQSGIALTTNEWAFLTTTCDGTNHKLYLNGTFLGQAALSGAQIETPEVLAINYLTGTGIGLCTFEFNYLEIYDKALTAGEISTIYTNTVGRFAPAPPAYQGIVGGRQFAQGFNG